MFHDTFKFQFLFLLISSMLSTCIWAQDEVFLEGVVLDAEDQSPVSFATVRIKNRSIGVITNADGSFRLPEFFKEEGEQIEISSLGYKSSTIFLSDWAKGEIKTVLLEADVEELDEVVVVGKRVRLTAQQILMLAFKNIPRNYPTDPYSYIGYYRDYQVNEGDYLNLNEAIIQIYDQGFGQDDFTTTEANIIRLQRNTNFPRDTTTSVPYDYVSGVKVIPKATIEDYSGNELLILRIHDAIRNNDVAAFSYVDRLKSDFLKNHSFYRNGILSYQGERIYKISFTKQEVGVQIKGDIFVSTVDYGILKMDYQAYLLETKNFRSTSRQNEQLLFSVLVEYNRSDKYYLNYLSFRNYFEVIPPPDFYAKEFVWDGQKRSFQLEFNDMADPVTSTQSNNYKIKYYGQRIRIDSVRLLGTGSKVELFPKKSFKQDRVLSMINREDFSEDKFEVKLGSIKSDKGMVLNETESKGVDQFREFFMQRVVREYEVPEEGRLMFKSRPLFGQQPINPLAEEEQYWMNTPLKK